MPIPNREGFMKVTLQIIPTGILDRYVLYIYIFSVAIPCLILNPFHLRIA